MAGRVEWARGFCASSGRPAADSSSRSAAAAAAAATSTFRPAAAALHSESWRFQLVGAPAAGWIGLSEKCDSERDAQRRQEAIFEKTAPKK